MEIVVGRLAKLQNCLTQRTDPVAHTSHIALHAVGASTNLRTGSVVKNQRDRLTEIGIGIPQITAFTKTLMDRGFPLPHAAVTVEQAEQMILNLAKAGGTADVS